MQKTIIKPRRFTPLSFQEIKEYRELFWSLAYRDFKVRYAQASIGILWAILQPVISLIIVNVVFGKFAGVESGGLPHIVYATSGLACWTYFSYVLTNSGSSIITSQAMIKKIYFPRIIVPVSKAFVGLIDFGIVFIILASLMFYFGIIPSSNIVFLPLFILLNILGALGIGIWISALTVRFRDFQYVVPFLVQIGLYASPVAFPSEYATRYLPEWAANLYFLNPVVGIIDGFRWSVFGLDTLTELSWISMASTIVIFVSGVIYFQKVEGKIADIV